MGNKLTAIILAAGSGTRMGLDVTKQMLLLKGKTVLERTVMAFSECEDVSEIIVVSRKDEVAQTCAMLSVFPKVSYVVSGGKSRAESAKIGFFYADKSTDYVAIHDGARCLVTPKTISAVFKDAVKYGAATASVAVSDSVKLCEGGVIVENIDRDSIRLMQTPQIFKKSLYADALLKAESVNEQITDDTSLLTNAGIPVFCTETGRENIKITVADDIEYAEFLLTKRGE